MDPQDFHESRRRSFASLWPVADGYRIEGGYLLPLGEGSPVRPIHHDGQDAYLPMARPELPRELAKAATGDDDDILAFTRRYGLLGYMQAWSFPVEEAGITWIFGEDSEQAAPGLAPGDPVASFVGHAKTVQLVLNLIGALGAGDGAVREHVELLKVVRGEHGGIRDEVIGYDAAQRGYLRPVQCDMSVGGEPRHVALRIIEHVLNANLPGISRQLSVQPQEDGELGFESLFEPHNLADCVYWHLADAAAGGWVRRCADPRCQAFFVAQSARVQYCPPPRGYRGVSPCMNRTKVRRHHKHKEEARERHEAGESIKAIGEALGRATDTVCRWVEDADNEGGK